MATTASQILQRVGAVLAANVPVGTGVDRGRPEAESLQDAPSVNVTVADHGSEPFSDELDQHDLTLELAIYVRADDALLAAEAIHEAFHLALVTDPALLTLCDSIRHRESTGEPQEADTTSLIKKPRYLFRYCIPKHTL